MEILFKEHIFEKSLSDFPQTRYQGSKYKLLTWVWENISFLDFEKVADLFGGTAAVSYLMKINLKSVAYNDLLRSNYFTGLALIENNETTISKFELNNILQREDDNHLRIISSTFQNIYYTTEENNWLDRNKISDAFLELISHYRNSHLVISYRSDGIPSVNDLIKTVKQFKRNYKIVTYKNYKYVLSTNNKSDEILIIGWD